MKKTFLLHLASSSPQPQLPRAPTAAAAPSASTLSDESAYAMRCAVNTYLRLCRRGHPPPRAPHQGPRRPSANLAFGRGRRRQSRHDPEHGFAAVAASKAEDTARRLRDARISNKMTQAAPRVTSHHLHRVLLQRLLPVSSICVAAWLKGGGASIG